MIYKVVFVVGFSPASVSADRVGGFNWYPTRAEALEAFIKDAGDPDGGPGCNWTLCEIPVDASLSNDDITLYIDKNLDLIEPADRTELADEDEVVEG